MELVLIFADQKHREKYWKRAEAWGEQQDWAYYHKDKYPALKGLAEFFANQDGYTIFQSYTGREYERV